MNSKVETTEIDLSVTSEGRKCTDLLCLLFFIVFSVVWVAVGGYAVMIGDPYRVVYATDYNGDTCGTQGRGKYAYYPRLSDDLADAVLNNPGVTPFDLSPDMINLWGICMDECPAMNQVVCNYGVTTPTIDYMSTNCNSYILRQLNPTCQECWVVPLNSANMLYRCLWQEATVSTSTEVCELPPDADVTSTDCISKKVVTTTVDLKPAQSNSVIDGLSSFGGTLSKWLGDIQKSFNVIVICGIVVAMCLGFFWLVFLQYCAGVMVWTTLWGSCLLALGSSLFCFYQAGYFTVDDILALADELAASTNITIDYSGALDSLNSSLSGFEDQLPDSARAAADDTQMWALGAWAMLVVGIALLCICIAMKKKVKKAIGVLKEASKAIQDIPVTQLYPIVTLIFTIIVVMWYMVSAAAIKSLGEFTLDSLNVSGAVANLTEGTGAAAVNSYKESELSTYLTFFNIFGFLWAYNFIEGVGMMTVAGTIGEWYFTRPPAEGKKDLPNSTLFKAFCRVFKFHLGSVAFGSFIIAAVQLMRVICEYVDKQTKGLQDGNKLLKIAMKVVKCCLWCFEKCVKFLTFNAYVIVATRGVSFCKGAMKSFGLILGNIATIGILNLVAAFMMLLGKLFIVFMSVYSAYMYIDMTPAFQSAQTNGGVAGELELSNPFIPIGLTGLIAFAMASSFLGVYGMAIDTIMICFCEDLAAFGENKPDEYYMGSDLRSAMGYKGEQKRAAPVADDKAGKEEAAGGDAGGEAEEI